MIEVTIMADSISPRGHRLTTFKCKYWRAILAEVNTHRMLTRNSPSSRAIPVVRMMESLVNDPAMPVSWPRNQAGMQASEDCDLLGRLEAEKIWLRARDSALRYAEQLSQLGVHKQVTNRLLEPWMWTTSLISGTDWENFFHLRVHKDAQPDFQQLAYEMLVRYLESRPKELEYGEWHMPFGDKIDPNLPKEDQVKIVVGRAARVSYLTQEGDMDCDKDIGICNRLIGNNHWSPAEHAATAEDTDSYIGNFKGWAQYRKHFPESVENRRGNLRELLDKYEAVITKPD